MRYVASLAVLLGLTGTAGAVAAPIEGLWFTKGDRSRVEVAPCGERLCGVIKWLREPNGTDGQPLVDALNERGDERGRPILGLPVLLDLTPGNDGRFVGKVYDPERGQYFDVWVGASPGSESLTVEGCALGGLICETETWRRAPPVP